MMGPTQPMNIFLGQEIDRIQKVIEIVKSTLEDLLLAIDGIIIMNEVFDITDIYFNLIILFINYFNSFYMITIKNSSNIRTIYQLTRYTI